MYDGIGIWGCDFQNSNQQFYFSSKGIYTEDANFIVDALGSTPSRFEGFRTGIEALNIYDLHNYTVRNTEFVDNRVGIDNRGVNSPLVKNCSFNVGSTNSQISHNYGILLNGGTGYIIEENTFEGAHVPFIDRIGIVARATGNEWNSIYKNDFSRLDFANLSNGDNTGGPDAGLKYECNLNSDNRYDFSVPLEFGNFGISEVQSGPFDQPSQSNLPAGNTFTSDLFSPLLSQFYNRGEELDYLANGDNPEEVLNLAFTGGVSQSQIFNNSNLCEAHMFTDGGPQLTKTEKESLKGEFNYHLNILNDLKSEASSTGSGNEISSEDLAEISGHANKVYGAANILIYDLLSDSTNTELDSLRTWWSNKNSLDADYSIINSYIIQKDTNTAKQLTAAIPINRTLSTKQVLDYNNFKAMQELKFDLIRTNRNWAELDASEINILLLVADDAEGRAGIRAQNLLSFHYGFDYFREATLPEFSAQENADEESPQIEGTPLVLWNAYPNPATNEVVIEYSLPEEAKNPVLLIHDSNGRVILLQDLDSKTTRYIWATTALENGVYFYTLKYNERMQQTKQVLIMK